MTRFHVHLNVADLATSVNFYRGLFGADDVRPGFAGIEIVVDIAGPHEVEQFDELRRVVDAHCPVHDLFSNATPVTSRLA